ncbi:amidohydrolase [Sediminispirochaeta smaragdinae]|uniref:Amidohydrolase n=1 Tax=Sediminispirochaeta smaragdinae (strain DSM 11293 / JCM 15392 / SEBR 4228) TaxID=573413 RepID=E1R4N4_SEDSS|nr:amidohydrolase [Sediminispirochaeta smaragdinae]ADK82122.1 amidohydrolase [Sediminispirochaeta smaragdinae DSM 11293]
MEYYFDTHQLYHDFEHLHDTPEIAFQEYRTSRFIQKELKKIGFSVRKLGDTGLLAHMEGKQPGPAIALRADMDALSFYKEDGSVQLLHACGHDAHSAMVLAAGRHFAAQNIDEGILYLLFQPGEESMLGAKRILAHGLPHIDGMIGIHLRPKIEMPLGSATPALLHCASLPITAHFHGKAAHAARPFLGINAVSSAAMLIHAVDTLTWDTDEDWSAKATVVDSHQNQHNIIPEFCSVTLDIRAQSNELGSSITQKIKMLAKEAADKFGTTLSFEENPGYAPNYDPSLIDICRNAINTVLGKAEPPTHTPGSEDFHAYSMIGGIPTAYIGLGADLLPGLHSPDMHFDHSCLPIGTAILIEAVNSCFKRIAPHAAAPKSEC